MREETLRENELLRALLDASIDGVLAFDRECRYTLWNAAMERLSGLARAVVVGRYAFEVFPFLKETGEDWYFYEALAGRSVVAERRAYTVPETGQGGLFDGYYSPLRDAGGAVVGGVGIIRDITASHAAEAARRASEERYRAFITNSSEGIWRFELEQPVPINLPPDEQIELFYRYGYLAECNDAMARMYGYERAEEISGARLGDFLVRNDPNNIAYLRAFIAAGYRLSDAESVEVDKTGRTRFFLNNLVGVVEDGRTLRAWGSQREITERKRAEEEHKRSEEKYRSLLENANDIIYSHDLAGNYLTINRACAEVTGYTREEILGGLNIAQVVVPEHLERAKQMMALKFHDPTPTVYEIDIVTKDGRRLTLEVSTRIARYDGQPAFVEGIGRDVTERKRAEREREELFAREQRARQEAEEALGVARNIEASLGVLAEASGVLLGSLTLADVQPAILNLARRLISADAYAIWRCDDASQTWRIVASAGLSEDFRSHLVEDRAPGNQLTGPFIAEDVAQVEQLAERRATYRAEGIRSLLAVPMRIHGTASGTLTYYYRQPYRFSDRELRVATALANLAGAAIGSAELYDEQRRLGAAAQAAEWRSNFLSEASRVLFSTLDYEATLARVARLSVPDLADWCAVDILEEDHSVKRLAVAHIDPAKVEWAREIQERYPPDMNAPTGVPQVLRTGRSEVYPDITDELLVAAAVDAEHLRLLRAIGFSSVMLVPLIAHGRTHGVITFITAESGRRYEPQDLALAEDLASRAAVAIENSRLYHATQQANRMKDEFLATVSHELRTPLTAILGWANILGREVADEATRAHAVEVIERNAHAQQQLIEDILEVSRIISGKIRIDARLVELMPLVVAAREAVEPAATAKGIELEFAYDLSAAAVLGDPDRLQQVFWNLLSNAVKFTPPGGRVSLSVARTGTWAEVVVSDTGEGIAPEFLPHVFERFRQADMGTTRQHGGLGLGLAIVRHLVEIHGGTVRAESAGRGHGSVFTVRLPLRGGEPVPQSRVAATQSAVPEVAQPEQYRSLAGVRLLVVEDEPDTLTMLSLGLSMHGAEVATARSAAEGLTAFARTRPDVLISDIGLPETDGYDLIRQVRALPAEQGGRTPAVALTAYARTEDRLKALAAGYQMHVPKPVELTELVAVVADLAGRSA